MKTKTGVTIVDKKFIYNEEKETIVCILKCTLNPYLLWHRHAIDIDYNYWKHHLPKVNVSGDFTAVGIAICNSVDTYNEETGRRIAESRAKVKVYATAKKFYEIIANELQRKLDLIEYKEHSCALIKSFEEKHVSDLIENT